VIISGFAARERVGACPSVNQSHTSDAAMSIPVEIKYDGPPLGPPSKEPR